MSNATNLNVVKRDRWKRPLIIPPEGGKEVAYTRVSTMSKAINDSGGLIPWNQRLTALGLAARPDLLLGVQSLQALHNNPLDDAKKPLDELIEQAREQAGASKASTTGTAIHGFMEAAFNGRDLPPSVPDEHRERVEQIVTEIDAAGFDVIETELFVVNDTVQAAGTCDLLLLHRDSGAVIVGDLKTGSSDPSYPLPATIQIATYANGQRYDPKTGERTPLHEHIQVERGLLVHAPSKGEGVRLYELDLTVGWAAAQVANRVHEIRKIPRASVCVPL